MTTKSPATRTEAEKSVMTSYSGSSRLLRTAKGTIINMDTGLRFDLHTPGPDETYAPNLCISSSDGGLIQIIGGEPALAIFDGLSHMALTFYNFRGDIV